MYLQVPTLPEYLLIHLSSFTAADLSPLPPLSSRHKKTSGPKDILGPYQMGKLASLFPNVDKSVYMPKMKYPPDQKFPCARGCPDMVRGDNRDVTAHLKESHLSHFGNDWDDDKDVRCIFQDKCNKLMKLGNLGRHICEHHFGSLTCHCGFCGEPFSRPESLVRHCEVTCGPRRIKRIR
jgi:hypothetical protein